MKITASVNIYFVLRIRIQNGLGTKPNIFGEPHLLTKLLFNFIFSNEQKKHTPEKKTINDINI